MPAIHFHLYDPSAPSLFKPGKNDHAKSFVVTCDHTQGCELYGRGQCVRLQPLNGTCKYGNLDSEQGPTRRAAGYHAWVRQKQQQYECVGRLSASGPMMAMVNKYVFLPYSFMGMIEGVGPKNGGFLADNLFIPKDQFTLDLVKRIVEAKPRALFGGVIHEYQEKVVPLFLRHLKDCMPELFDAVCAISERARELRPTLTNVGRKAILQTLVPNVGEFVDSNGTRWTWDGEWLTAKDVRTLLMITSRCSEVRLKPAEDVIVVITDDRQVCAGTVFKS